MSTLFAMRILLCLLGVVPFLNSSFRMANSVGEVLLLFLRASLALSIFGSLERKVSWEWEMKAKLLLSSREAFLFLETEPGVLSWSLMERSDLSVLLLMMFFEEKMFSLPEEREEVLSVDLNGVEAQKLDSLLSEVSETLAFLCLERTGKMLVFVRLRERCSGVDWLRMGASGSLCVSGVAGTNDLL